MDDSAETTDLINRRDEAQTYKARRAAGPLPKRTYAAPEGITDD
jgi:hypothetical protein